MTTYTAFTPTSTQLFQFAPTLDGNQYTAIVTWNAAAQRWYLNIYSATVTGATTASGLIVALPLIGSPVGYDINIVAGYFATSTLVFRESTQNFEVTP